MDVREKLVELLKEIVAIQECGFGDPRPTYETVASYLMSHGVTVQECVSVKDRLPKDMRNVIVTTFWHEKCVVHVGWYSKFNKIWYIITPQGDLAGSMLLTGCRCRYRRKEND